VTLPPFDLHRPRSLEEATELLDRYGDDAAPYCGGTELLLLLKLGLASLRHLVDLKGIDELRGVRRDDGVLVVGAAVAHRELECSPVVHELLPALAAMERRVANIRVRHVGTLGGNLCFSDPRSDPMTFLLALDAELECRRGGAMPRRIPARDFFVGPYQTALAAGEILTSVRIPVLPPVAAIVHEKFAFYERPSATVTCLLRTRGGEVADARIAVGSVGPRPTRASEAERRLMGAPISALDEGKPVEEVATLAAEACGAVDDATGSADYKANLVRVLVTRSVRRAISSAA
jgi:carbon-monoxide dehydrogenase medium subunit